MSITSAKSGATGISLALDNNYMEPIATTLVGASGVNSVVFNDIPQGYKHLQLRISARTNRPTYNIDGLRLRFNGDTGSNYSSHTTTSDPVTGGTTTYATTSSSQNNVLIGQFGTTVSTSTYGASIIDIVNYSSTNQNKTLRALTGVDTAGGASGYSGYNGLYSGGWFDINPISSIYIYSDTLATIQQYSRFSLYGIKG